MNPGSLSLLEPFPTQPLLKSFSHTGTVLNEGANRLGVMLGIHVLQIPHSPVHLHNTKDQTSQDSPDSYSWSFGLYTLSVLGVIM